MRGLIFVLLISLTSLGQSKKIVLLKNDQKNKVFTYFADIDIAKRDTSYYCDLTFRNAEYPSLIDMQYVLLPNEYIFEKFRQDCREIVTYLKSMDKSEMTWSSNFYVMSTYENEKKIMLMNKRNGVIGGYINYTQAELLSLLTDMERVLYGSFEVEAKKVTTPPKKKAR